MSRFATATVFSAQAKLDLLHCYPCSFCQLARVSITRDAELPADMAIEEPRM
jgi:hypothetical protein